MRETRAGFTLPWPQLELTGRGGSEETGDPLLTPAAEAKANPWDREDLKEDFKASTAEAQT